MLKGLCKKNYNLIVQKLVTTAQTVADETMHEAVKELLEGKSHDERVDTRVSVEGTCQNRGYSFHNGIMAGLSITNGKVLDVEAIFRKCKIFNRNQDTVNLMQHTQAENKTHF